MELLSGPWVNRIGHEDLIPKAKTQKLYSARLNLRGTLNPIP